MSFLHVNKEFSTKTMLQAILTLPSKSHHTRKNSIPSFKKFSLFWDTKCCPFRFAKKTQKKKTRLCHAQLNQPLVISSIARVLDFGSRVSLWVPCSSWKELQETWSFATFQRLQWRFRCSKQALHSCESLFNFNVHDHRFFC